MASVEIDALPAAERLKTLGIPFVFATGYGEGGVIPNELADVPIVRKPYDADTLLRAVGRALAPK